MWLDCNLFEFRHLPSPGGILAQDPKFLEVCRIIASAQAKAERQKEAREKYPNK